MYNLSIIIPHYNTPDTLKRLLNTIPKRSNLEIIVVDDKSDKFVEKYQEIMESGKYDHVKFLTNDTEKKGAGVCRNIGLRKSNGKWVLFADADDYFIEGFYEVVEKYFEKDYDVVFFAPTSIYEDTKLPSNRHVAYENIIKNYLEGRENSELYLRYYFRSPCSKMIKRNFLIKYNIEFDETLVCNDDFFSVKVGYYMRNFTATMERIYCIVDSSQSLSKKKGNIYFRNCVNVMIKIDIFLRKHLEKSSYKKVRLYGISIIRWALRKTPMSIFEAIKIIVDNKLPLMPMIYMNPIYIINKVINKPRNL